MKSSTLAIIKPDAVERKLTGEIIAIIEHHFTIESIQWIESEDRAKGSMYWDFYARQHKGKDYFDDLVHFMISGPSVALIIHKRGEDAIPRWREEVKSIRGLYVLPDRQLCENLVHGSDSRESFEHEVKVLGW